MKNFKPDFNNILDAAKNIQPKRLPLYEHLISDKLMERVIGREFSGLLSGIYTDKLEYFRIHNNFFLENGYDTVTYECCFGLSCPGSGALGGHKKGIIGNRDDFLKYPWGELSALYFERYYEEFMALGEAMPDGMKAIGGVGNGVFEVVQDLVGYQDLCYMSVDDPELYAEIFSKAGDVLSEVWSKFLKEFSDLFCVCRFGDDLGFKSQTLLPVSDIKTHIIPAYKKIIDVIHRFNKPFLLHSCGNIFDVMDDIIDIAGIDAKHSNEDQIALFPVWVEKYGKRIGNFGGIDTDMVCRGDMDLIRDYSLEVLKKCDGQGGFAFGTGNAIAEYVDEERWLKMVNTAREYRGDK